MNSHHEYIIIGAGPAGLQLGYFFEKNQRDYLILERANSAGSFFKEYPRHRKLISINKVHTGTDNNDAILKWDWNSLLSDNLDLRFPNYNQRYFPPPDDLVQYLEDYASYYDINVKYNVNVINIKKNEGRFTITDEDNKTYTSNQLIVATGLFKPYEPNIPGIELCENYITHDIDPHNYTNQRVLVIGKGNSGFETAENLIETAAVIHIASPESVRFAWQTHFVGNLRAVNNNFLDTYQLKSQNTVIDAEIKQIEKKNGKYFVTFKYSHANDQMAVEHYDHVIVCTGFRFDVSIFDKNIRPLLAHDDKLPAQTSEWESSNVQGLYFAGTLMQACDYKKTMSGFIHGFRHNIEALTNIFERKYHGTPWPGEELEINSKEITDKIIERVNNAPGMFLQPGFLGDAVIINNENATYLGDLRLDYIHESDYGKNNHYYTVSLEYGSFRGDPFRINRDPDPAKGKDAPYLHPVIRHYDQGKLIAEHHIQDDLENRWYRDEFVHPALSFMEMQLGSTNERDKIKM